MQEIERRGIWTQAAADYFKITRHFHPRGGSVIPIKWGFLLELELGLRNGLMRLDAAMERLGI